MTKRQRRSLRDQDVLTDLNSINTQKFNMRAIKPKTSTQADAIVHFNQGSNLLLHGLAGTGKTFIAMYLAINEVIQERAKRVVVIRSAVPTRDVGFLPGTLKQKMEVYELPYKQIANNLFKRGDAYDILKNKDMLDFISTSYVRGTTLDNCIVVVDEINNMTFHELDSVITRLGDDTQLILCGDYRQSDLLQSQEKQGLRQFMNIIDRMNMFEHVEFGVNDIVRSALVKQYIIEKAELGYV
jgi:phosphate starvation-inducible protein PhoH|tara:strand:- start:4644 stop:5366 length:723 start_codon:yes stop_codon:yes gene_type:complete